MAAPIVMLLILLILEMGFLLTGGVFLEAGARAAARAGIVGGVSTNREAMIREIVTRYVCPSSLPESTKHLCFWTADGGVQLEEGSPLRISMRAYSDPRNVGVAEPYADVAPVNGKYDPGESFSDVNGNGVWDPDMARTGAGGSGDVVVYELEMPQRIINPLLQAIAGGSVFRHAASLVVRNEPF